MEQETERISTCQVLFEPICLPAKLLVKFGGSSDQIFYARLL